ncbi:MAG: hypothetical protein AAF431_04790 [Pseudomonadota bacterium]
MATIKFRVIPESGREDLISLFELIKSSKEAGIFNSEEIWSRLPGYVKSNFFRGDKGESIDNRWDFLSWVDALEHCEQEFIDINFSWSGGKLEFNQLSYPSGGVEATEEIVKAFNGKITSNNAI